MVDDDEIHAISLDPCSVVVGWHEGGVTDVKFRSRRPHIISSGSDGVVAVWECRRTLSSVLGKPELRQQTPQNSTTRARMHGNFFLLRLDEW